MTLTTRKPTGNPAFPLILVEGEEKAGKSYVAAQLSASPNVGRTFAWDLGDGTLDEYAPLGPYEIVETDGTYTGLLESVREACAIPAVDGKPNVYVLDSGTDLWDLLKRWTDGRARNSRTGRKVLAEDPDAEIDPTMNLWNDAKDRWAAIMNELRRAPGIGVVTAQGREVSRVQGGQPVAGQTEWSIQAEKTLTSSANAWVRMKRDPRMATLIGCRRLGLEVPRGGLDLPLDGTLHHLIFEVIGAGGTFEAPKVTAPQVGMTGRDARRRVYDAVKANTPGLGDEDLKAEARRVWEASGLGGDDIAPALVAEVITGIVENGTGSAPEPAPAASDAPVAPDTAPEQAEAPTGPDTDPVDCGHICCGNVPPCPPGSHDTGPDECPFCAEERVGLEQADLDNTGGGPIDPPVADVPGPDTTDPPAPAADARPILTAAQIGSYRKPDLIAALADRGLSTAGNMGALAERLIAHDTARAAS